MQLSTRYNRPEKEQDIVARYGGEEMILMLKNLGAPQSMDVAERIRKAVAEAKFQWEETVIPVTVSLGVSALRAHDTVDTLIKRADEGLYRAKKAGKNRVYIEE